MRITFCGANQGVTGSCHLLEAKNKKILIDCGMFQGSDFNEATNFDSFPFDSKEIDAVLVTHAHLDHVGRLPKLVKGGFDKEIYMTKATAELAELILRDACEIMSYENRKFQSPVLYDTADVAATLKLFRGVDYHEPLDFGDGVKALLKDAGHIFGSAFVEIEAEDKKICFSGDIGNIDEPIVRDTENIGDCDVLVCESTYGDSLHGPLRAGLDMLLNLFRDTFKKGGTLMIPTFSLERTQELLYELNQMSEHEHTMPQMPVFLDSPLAIDATKVYEKYSEFYDKEAAGLHLTGDDFLKFPQLKITYTKEESKAINDIRGPKAVIAGSGMMNGGRILHHARRYLSDPSSALLLIGYQAEGTLGRRLSEGVKHVRIFGDEITVRCNVKATGALSAHGDQKKLIEWIGSGTKPPKAIYFVHGEPHAAKELARLVGQEFGINAVVPKYGETFEI